MRLFIEATVLIVWALKGGSGVSDGNGSEVGASSLRKSWTLESWAHLVLMMLGIFVLPHFVSPMFMKDGVKLVCPNGWIFFFLVFIWFIYLIQWLVFIYSDKYRGKGAREYTYALSLFTSLGFVAFSMATFAISALGADSANPSMWWLVGTGVSWLIPVLIGYGGIKAELTDFADELESH